MSWYPYVYLHYKNNKSPILASDIVLEIPYDGDNTNVEEMINWGYRYADEHPINNLILEMVGVKRPRGIYFPDYVR